MTQMKPLWVLNEGEHPQDIYERLRKIPLCNLSDEQIYLLHYLSTDMQINNGVYKRDFTVKSVTESKGIK